MPLRSYIGGAENYLLRTVAEAVLGGSLSCERQSFYPLVLYGPTGTGKSHLVRGLLARWEVAHPEERIIMTSGRDFSACFPNTSTIRSSTAGPRSDCAKLSWLFVDNLDELAGRLGSQQLLCAVIDKLELFGGRLVGIARRRPAEIGIDAALVSRLSAGLAIRMHPPEVGARTALLKKIADVRGLLLESRAAELLAHSLPYAFPQLRRAVLQLELFTAPRRKLVLNDTELFLGQRSHYDALKSLGKMVAQHCSIPVQQLKGPSRERRLVSARGLFVYLARQNIQCSFSAIGRFLGGRDRSTVSHAFVTTTKSWSSNLAVRQTVEELQSQIALHDL